MHDLEAQSDKWALTSNNQLIRTITNIHPLPIVLSWLPLTISNTNVQTLSIENSTLLIREDAVIVGLPVKPHVIQNWEISSSSPNHCCCRIDISFEYEYGSWLSSAVESNTIPELQNLYRIYLEETNKHISKLRQMGKLTDDVLKRNGELSWSKLFECEEEWVLQGVDGCEGEGGNDHETTNERQAEKVSGGERGDSTGAPLEDHLFPPPSDLHPPCFSPPVQKINLHSSTLSAEQKLEQELEEEEEEKEVEEEVKVNVKREDKDKEEKKNEEATENLKSSSSSFSLPLQLHFPLSLSLPFLSLLSLFVSLVSLDLVEWTNPSLPSLPSLSSLFLAHFLLTLFFVLVLESLLSFLRISPPNTPSTDHSTQRKEEEEEEEEEKNNKKGRESESISLSLPSSLPPSSCPAPPIKSTPPPIPSPTPSSFTSSCSFLIPPSPLPSSSSSSSSPSLSTAVPVSVKKMNRTSSISPPPTPATPASPPSSSLLCDIQLESLFSLPSFLSQPFSSSPTTSSSPPQLLNPHLSNHARV